MINVKLTIEGVTYSDYLQMDLEKSIGEFNSTSNVSIEFNNFIGIHKDSFSLNDEVIIYADKDTDPATTKIFTGIIEKIRPFGEPNNEIIKISGRDYGAVLQDMSVQPVIFKNKDAGIIARTIIQNNAEGIVTHNNVNLSTGVTITKIGFNHESIFDGLRKLAELAECYFYVDADKDVHFILKETISSGLTFNNTNVTKGNFVTTDKEIFNKVWVYGSRILTGNSEYLKADGTGSIFTLTDRPHNTRVYISGTTSTIVQKGGVAGMVNPALDSDVKWVVNFDEKQVVFLSGAAAGDNIPIAGSVYIEYERLTPILKFRQDQISINNYGPKTKVITDSSIKSYDDANEKAIAFLAENKDEKIQGDLDIKGVIAIIVGNTAVVDLPWHGIDSQTYTILSVNYSFNKTNCLSEKVLHITLNKKIANFTDTLKNQMVRINAFEAGPLEGEFTTLKTVIRYVDVDSHWEVWTGAINNNFVFHSAKHGKLESPDSRIGVGNLAQGILGSTLIESGGGF